jgi:hypothetical protein
MITLANTAVSQTRHISFICASLPVIENSQGKFIGFYSELLNFYHVITLGTVPLWICKNNNPVLGDPYEELRSFERNFDHSYL